MKKKFYTIISKNHNFRKVISAESELAAVRQVCGKHFQDFYPPYPAGRDHKYILQNSRDFFTIKVKEGQHKFVQ